MYQLCRIIERIRYINTCEAHRTLLGLICISFVIHLFTYKGTSLVAQTVKSSSCLQCRRSGFDPWVRKILWRRKWQPTPVLLPGKSHGPRSLVGHSPWGRRESDTTERLHFTSLLLFTYNGSLVPAEFYIDRSWVILLKRSEPERYWNSYLWT